MRDLLHRSSNRCSPPEEPILTGSGRTIRRISLINNADRDSLKASPVAITQRTLITASVAAELRKDSGEGAGAGGSGEAGRAWANDGETPPRLISDVLSRYCTRARQPAILSRRLASPSPQAPVARAARDAFCGHH